MEARTEVIVPAEAGGQRLDAYLAGLESVGSRSRAAKLIAEGSILVDGSVARKSHTLGGGEQISLTLATDAPVTDAHEPAIPFSVVYEDDALLIVDKPAGLVVHPGPGNQTGTLSQALAGRAAGGDPDRPGIVHRLDKDTSGLLVVAKNDVVLRSLQKALQAREVKREYRALVKGRPQSLSGTIDAPLGRDRRTPDVIAVRSDSPREAVTHFEVLEELPAHTLLRVTLETGRTHQIRAHLAAIGLPVSGDPTYGVGGDLGLQRQFLHAAVLEFDHPLTGEHLRFESVLPIDLQTALGAAKRPGG